MKALVYQGAERVEVCDVPKPVPREGQALLHVKYCGICGSDIGIYSGSHPRAKAPLIMGHEFVGIIEEIRGNAKGFQVGDLAVPYPLISCQTCFSCRNGREHVCDELKIVGIDVDGGIAEYVCCSTDVLFKVPEGVPARIAGIAEPLAVAVHSLRRSGFRPLDCAAILGAGPIGTLIGIMAKHSGASRVIIADFDQNRLSVCRNLGLEPVDTSRVNFADYVKSVTGGTGADVVFECTGAEAAAAEMTLPCRTDGMICLVGVHKNPRPVLLSDMHFRELNLTATRVYTKREFGMAVDLLKRIQPELDQVANYVVPLSDCAGIFEDIRNPERSVIKAMVKCGE